MITIKGKTIPLPGYRNIKTALAIIVCVILYEGVLNRGGAELAAVAAIICMQDTIGKSLNSGIYRVLGSIVGGIFGIIFASMTFLDSSNVLWFLGLFVGVVLLIHMFNLMKKHDSIVIGVIVFVSIVLGSEGNQGNLLIEAVDMVINTLFGIVVAVSINSMLFRPDRRTVKNKSLGNISLHYDFKNALERKTSTWSGGNSTELYIYPKHSFYSEQNFKWRLSTETIETENSVFTRLDGYMRLIMVTGGHMQLAHKGHHAVFLKPYQTDFFNGEWETNTYGMSTDFNLIMRPEYDGNFECVYNKQSTDLVYCDVENDNVYSESAFYALYDNSTLNVLLENRVVFTKEMQQYDFIVFFDLHLFADNSLEVKWDVEGLEDYEVVAIRTDICDKNKLG